MQIKNYESIVDVVRFRARQTPAREMFRFLPDGKEDKAKTWTCEDLDRHARMVASELQCHGSNGQPVLLLVPPGNHFLEAFFGCLYCGSVAVPVPPPGLGRLSRTLPRIRHVISDCQAALIVTTSSLQPAVDELLKISSLNNVAVVLLDHMEEKQADTWLATENKKDQLAFLQYTSGSTGNPKGVMVSHGNVLANLEAMSTHWKVREEMTYVNWLPPFHDMGLLGCILMPVFSGSFGVLLPPVSFLQRPTSWLEAIDRYRGNVSGGPNFSLEHCCRRVKEHHLRDLDLSCLEVLFCGSEPLRKRTVENFLSKFSRYGLNRKAFHPCYGLAETTLFVSAVDTERGIKTVTINPKITEEHKRPRFVKEDTDHGLTLYSCGRTADKHTVLIVDLETFTPLPEDRVGEVWISGPSVTRGYWKKETETKDTFEGMIKNDTPGKYLRTGDLGFFHEGELYISGRLKEMMILDGRNYFPQDIESTVTISHEALTNHFNAVFSVDLPHGCEMVVVQEIPSGLDNLRAITDSIRRLVSEDHGVSPATVVLVRRNSIPRTTSGKIQRNLCRTCYETGQLKTLFTWKESPVPALTLPHKNEEIPSTGRDWAAWLRKAMAARVDMNEESIDCAGNFSQFGLDSKKSAELVHELSSLLGQTLPISLFYDHPSISSLAEYLAGNHSKQNISIRHTLKKDSNKIAIIGLSCCFPGAAGPEEFGNLLLQGSDAIRRVPGNRWQISDGDDTRGLEWGGFIDSIFDFDPGFFRISPREAREMDPQQRLLLRLAWQVFERAAIAPDKLSGSQTGVFVGISTTDFANLRSAEKIPVNQYVGTGNAHCAAANRLSYILGLRGPSLAVDTACSSSLVAIHLACRSIRSGESDMALAGGVNVMLSPEPNRIFAAANLMAANGRCKTFSDEADGYVRSEGCGLLLLKRLDTALADNDTILGVIAGSAINQDGPSNGFTAPSREAQSSVIVDALTDAGTTPEEIDLVEAHGTGTPLGDPIEVSALADVFSDRDASAPLYITSVKTNIGHLEAAAGIAGLAKVLIALEHEIIPAHLHLNRLNRNIHLLDIPAVIATTASSWPRNPQRTRKAGISSFGFGGTNAHVIIEEAPCTDTETEGSAQQERPVSLLTVSAFREEDLKTLVGQYADSLAGGMDLASFCHTAHLGRAEFIYRLALPCSNPTEAAATLRKWMKGDSSEVISGRIPAAGETPLIFYFPDSLSLNRSEGKELYNHEPVFREAVDHCKNIFQKHAVPLDFTAPFQGLQNYFLFTLQYGLAKLWQAWGVQPEKIVASGTGKYAPLCLYGYLSLAETVHLLVQTSSPRQTQTNTVSNILAHLYAPETGPEFIDSTTGTVLDIDKLRNINHWITEDSGRNKCTKRLPSSHISADEQLVILGHDLPPEQDMNRQQGNILRSLGREGEDYRIIFSSLARIWLNGRTVNWQGFREKHRQKKIKIPTYPFSNNFAETPLRHSWNSSQSGGKIEEGLSPVDTPALQTIRPDSKETAGFVEQQLASVTGIDVKQFGDHEISLLSLGLDSMMFMEVNKRLKKSLNIEVSVSAFFARPTLSTLLSLIEEKLASGERAETHSGIEANPSQQYEPFPLTDIQRAYWIGRNEGLVLGNISCSNYLEIDFTNIDLNRLKISLEKLVQRHDMLRAVISTDGVQRILPNQVVPDIEVEDLSGFAAEELKTELRLKRDRLKLKTLPTDTAPMFEIQVSKLPDFVYRFHINFDLLIADAWSFFILVREFAELYSQPDKVLPTVSLTFRDYVLAEQKMRQSNAFRLDLQYWKKRCLSMPHNPELPFDQHYDLTRPPRFSRYAARIEKDRWSLLKTKAATMGLTPSSVLLAAFAEVIAFWARKPHFVLTLTFFNRQPLHEDVGKIVGDFTSLILLEVERKPEQTFLDFATQVERQLREDMSHPRVSGVEVLSELRKIRPPGDAEQAAVVFTSALPLTQSIGEHTLTLPDELSCEVRYAVSQTPQVCLDHQVFEYDGALICNWDAVEDLFEKDVLPSMFETYRQFLESLLTDDGWQRIRCLHLPEKQEQIRRQANATQKPLKAACLHDDFLINAARAPEKKAIISAEKTVSYRELETASREMARLLRRNGVTDSSVVAIIMEKGWEQIVGVLGVVRSGAAYLPIAPDLPRQRIAYMLQDCQAPVILTQPQLFDNLADLVTGRILTVTEDLWQNDDPAQLDHIVQPDSLAYIIYTSGSTGKPKGVMISHGAAVNTIMDINDRFKITTDDAVFAVSNLHFDLSVYDIFGLLSAGGSIVLGSSSGKKDPSDWCDAMKRGNVTLWNSTPALLQMLLEYGEGHSELLPVGLKTVLLSGDWIPLSLPARLRAIYPTVRIIAMGGATEASIWSNFHEVKDIPSHWKSIPYGFPLANQRYHVLDSLSADRPDWVAGEIHIAGSGLALGYLNDPEKTATHFTTRPDSGERLYKTGDYGRYWPDGTLEFLGREDSQVKINGNRIELGEIESVMQRFPDTGSCAAVVAKDAEGLQRLIGFVSSSTFEQQGETTSPFNRQRVMQEQGISITGEIERLEHKQKRLSLRSPRPGEETISCTSPDTENLHSGKIEEYSQRISYRRFSPEPIPFTSLASLLGELRAIEHPDWPVPRYKYGSAGWTYSVQTYVFVKENRVEKVPGGNYYYHPINNKLVAVERPVQEADNTLESLFHEGNRAIFDSAAFALFLVCQQQAIKPLYGQKTDDFTLVEAGLMTQLLEMTCLKRDIGLCQIGGLEPEIVHHLFGLEEDHRYLHCLLGGNVRRKENWTFLDGLQESIPDSNRQELFSPAKIDELTGHISSWLPDYMVPSRIIPLSTIPLTENGKIDRKTLLKMAHTDPKMSARQEKKYLAPRNSDEQAIVTIFTEILGISKLGVLDNFFDIGATSLQLVQAQRRLSDHFGRNVKITELFNNPNIAALVKLFSKEKEPNNESITYARSRVQKRRQHRRQRRNLT